MFKMVWKPHKNIAVQVDSVHLEKCYVQMHQDIAV